MLFSSFSIPDPPAGPVSSCVRDDLLAIVQQDVLAYPDIFHELAKRAVIGLDVGENMCVFETFASREESKGSFSEYGLLLWLGPNETIDLNRLDFLTRLCELHS